MSEDMRAQLTEVGRRIEQAERDRAQAIADLAALARKADAEDFPLRQVALLAGVSRTTVYKMLED